MDAQHLKRSIIDLVEKENDLDRLETILKLMEVSQRDIQADAGLLESVWIAEKEYENGKGVTLEIARKILKKRRDQ